jgi:uncharacterized protein
MSLKEKYGEWALVTGASSGIGEEFAKRLAQEQMNLILVARRKKRLQILAKELKEKYQIKVVIAPVDLSKNDFIDDLKEFVGKREIAVLINNAGFGLNGEFIYTDPEQDAEMVKVNCLAPTILTHYFVPKMVEKRNGAILFLGSVVVFQPTPYMTTYAATKVFNAYVGDALWYELKKYNIDVLTINPGGTETEFQRISNASTGLKPRTAKQVVDTALKALGKKPSVIDGVINKMLCASARFTSRKFRIKIAGRIAEKLRSKKIN